jgi:hypothetical protein
MIVLVAVSITPFHPARRGVLANEISTIGEKVISGSRTGRFLKLPEMPGYVPLSGLTMEFDRNRKCVAGCM